MKESLEERECSLEYRHSPKLDFQELYEHVWTALSEGQCIGIFPEGGSHDRLQFLPFKAGIVIMALGAAHRFAGLNPVLLPCGFNYFNQDKFRSKVVIEFGQPFTLTQVFLDLYKSDKRSAISSSLALVESRLREVTLHAPSFNFLKTLFLLRQLYLPGGASLHTTQAKLRVVRSFAKTYQRLNERPEVQRLFSQATEYRESLEALAISYKFSRQPDSRLLRGCSVLWSLLRLGLCVGLSLPGTVLFSPVIVLIRVLSERERLRCLRESKVKLEARDIVASYKIILGAVLFPAYSVLASLVLYLVLRHYRVGGRLITSCACVLFWLVYAPVAIRSIDGVLSHFKILRSKAATLFYRDSRAKLLRMEEQLKREILRLVKDTMLPALNSEERTARTPVGFSGIDLNEMFEELNDLENI